MAAAWTFFTCCSSSCRRRKCGPPQCNEPIKDICIDNPYFNMCTFGGRFAHFATITSPLGAFRCKHHIDRSSDLIFDFRHHRLKKCLTEEELWRHRYITYANTHPDTREAYSAFARFPHQAMINALIAAGMLTYCNSYGGLAAWQFINNLYQSYLSWSHRNSPSTMSCCQLKNSFLVGAAASMGTACGLRYLMLTYLKRKPPFYLPKMIPLVAVVVGNLLAVPTMRAQELRYGLHVYDHIDRRIGTSVLAAQSDVQEQIIVRNTISTIPLLLAPFMIHPFRTNTSYWICRYPFLRKALLLAILGGLFSLSTPFALALFKCPGEMLYCQLEPCVRRRMERRHGNEVPYTVFFKSEY